MQSLFDKLSHIGANGYTMSRTLQLPVSKSAWLLLLTLASALAISVYQWLALYELHATGQDPTCAISTQINCASVWDSPLSTALHQTTGIPFAGWGTVWALACIGLFGHLLFARRKGEAQHPTLALRLMTGVAALITIALLIYSLSIGVFCPTCLAFYAAVWIAAGIAWRGLSTSGADWLMSTLQSLGYLTGATLLMLIPGMQTPLPANAGGELTAGTPAPPGAAGGGDPLAQFIANANGDLKQALSDTLAMAREGRYVKREVDTARLTYGPPESPVHLIEWVDIRCPHCRNLHAVLDELKRITPPGSWNVESRNYPLDSECNPSMPRTDGSGVRCLAARLLICMAGSNKEAAVRTAFFENQAQLTPDTLWRLSTQAGADKAQLETCTGMPGTTEQLTEDLRIAEEFGIEGTPMVVINDQVVPAFPALIYALILAEGNMEHPAFKVLPPPNPPPAH